MYKVGDKFEIEIESVFTNDADSELYAIKGFRSLVFDKNGLDKLKKVEEEPPKPKTVKASELKAGTIVICYDNEIARIEIRHFAGLLNGKMYAYKEYATSTDNAVICSWKFMELEDGTKVVAE